MMNSLSNATWDAADADSQQPNPVVGFVAVIVISDNK